MNMNKIDFFKRLKDSIKNESIVKITLSKPVSKSNDLLNVYIKPVALKGTIKYMFTYRYEKRDETKVYDDTQLFELVQQLIPYNFFNATLFTINEDITLLTNKKGKESLSIRQIKEQRERNLSHDHVKNRLINMTNPYWHKIGLATQDGNVIKDYQHKYKQICKYVEIIDGLLKNMDFNKTIHISDMGAGKGYLTFALYEYLTQQRKTEVFMEGVEMRHDLVLKLNHIIDDVKLENFRFVESTIENYNPQKIDILIALHACNTATDDAIIKGIQANSKLIICAPCCHKQIRQEMEKSGISDSITRFGIFMEREAVLITDSIRALILEYYGYKVNVMEFIEMEHTPKNVLIVGKKSNAIIDKEKIKHQISEIKLRYGIQEHYLEKIFKL